MPSSVVTGATIGIVGGGPAGLMLSHLLSLSGIDSVVVDNRTRLEIEQTVRAGILERDSVCLLVDSGVSDRVLREGHEHKGIDLAFAGSGHRIDFQDLTGSSVWLYPQTDVFIDLATSRAETRKVRPAARPYALRGLLLCAICKRKMQGHWVNDRAHYRCRYPSEYAASKELEHPRNVYLREDLVVPELDRWLASLFTPAHLPGTISALAEAQETDIDPGRANMLDAARRTLADCDQRLAKYRAGLEAGMDPGLVAQWTAEVRAQRLQAEQQLRPPPEERHLTEAEISQLVGGFRDIVKTLRRADPASKAAVYRELGLRLTYAPVQRTVLVEATPNMGDLSCPRGDLNSNPTSPLLRAELDLRHG